MRTKWLAAVLVAPSICLATEISVGGVALDVPNPQGFAALTPEMAQLHELLRRFVATTNEEFVSFIPERDVPAALRDEIPDLPRRLAVQTAKSLIAVTVSRSDFDELRSTVRNQNDELVRQAEQQFPGLTKQINDGVSKKYDVDLAFSISQVVPMPIHEETDRTLAYSSLVSYTMNDEEGNAAPAIAAVTATFVHVRGKVLFLYAFAEEEGLEWSREASRRWAAAVVGANPSDAATAALEESSRAAWGLDWRKVAEKGLSGAIVGLIIGLIGWAVSRSRGR